MSDAAPLRLYGRRKGKRLRPGQTFLLDELLPTLEITLPAGGEALDPRAILGHPCHDAWLEIGFGGGEHLAALAVRHPDVCFIGCEPFINGVVKLLSTVEALSLANVRIYPDDGRALLGALAPASLGRVTALFPDPWPKMRHHKRRLIQPETLDLIADRLAEGGELRLATDDPSLGEWMMAHVAAHSAFEGPADGEQGFAVRPDDWPATRYETKALRAGIKPFYLLYKRRKRQAAGQGRTPKKP